MEGAVLGARLAAQGHHGGLPGEVDPELARKGVRHRRTLQLIEQGREGRPAGEAGRGKAAAAVDSGKVALDRRQRLAPQEGRHDEEVEGCPLQRRRLEAFEVEMRRARVRSEEHTSELQSLMRIPYADFCLKKKKTKR